MALLSKDTRTALRAARMEVLRSLKNPTAQQRVELAAYELQIAAELSAALSTTRSQQQASQFMSQHKRKLGHLGQRYSKSPNKGSSPSVYRAVLPDGTTVEQRSYSVHMTMPNMLVAFDETDQKWVPHGIIDPKNVPKKKASGIMTGRLRVIPANITKWGHP